MPPPRRGPARGVRPRPARPSLVASVNNLSPAPRSTTPPELPPLPPPRRLPSGAVRHSRRFPNRAYARRAATRGGADRTRRAPSRRANRAARVTRGGEARRAASRDTSTSPIEFATPEAAARCMPPFHGRSWVPAHVRSGGLLNTATSSPQPRP